MMSRTRISFEPCPEEEGIKTPRAGAGSVSQSSSNPALKKKGLRHDVVNEDHP